MLDSRRYGRMEFDRPASDAWMLDFPLSRVLILNVSYGGICLEIDQPFPPGTECDMLLNLERPINEAALVTVAIRWARLAGLRWYCGAEIVSSDRAWIGPAPWPGPANTRFTSTGLRPWYLPKQAWGY